MSDIICVALSLRGGSQPGVSRVGVIIIIVSWHPLQPSWPGYEPCNESLAVTTQTMQPGYHSSDQSQIFPSVISDVCLNFSKGSLKKKTKKLIFLN